MEDLKPEIIRRHQSGESIATIAAILNAEPSAVAAVVDMLGSQPPTVSVYADALPEKMILAGKGGVVKARHDFSERVAAIKASMAQQSSDAVIMRAFSIRDLLDSVETPGWLIDGVIPDNGVTLMHAAPKIGKTTVIAGWMKALERDGEWAGRKSVGAPVLLLSEEGGNTLYDPIMELKLDIDSAHQIAPIEYAPEGWDWPEALARSTLYAELCGIRLIIIDTLQTWSDANDTNSYSETTSQLSVARAASRISGRAILVTHHDRKSGGDGILSAMGSAGLTAGADHIIKLSRQKGSNLLELEITSRFRTAAKELTVALTDGVYYAAEGTTESRNTERIDLAFIGAHATLTFTAKELAEKWKLSLNSAKKTIAGAVGAGELAEYPAEGNSKAKRFGRPKAGVTVSPPGFIND